MISVQKVRIESKNGPDFNCLDSVSLPGSGGVVCGVQLFPYGTTVLVEKEGQTYLFALPSKEFVPLVEESGYKILYTVETKK